MSDITLVWCHGSQASPWGNKSTALAEIATGLGATMEAPDFSHTEDPDERVAILLETLKGADKPIVLAGSSMGGYVAAAAAGCCDTLGLFLIAPAFYFPGYATHVFSNLPSRITVVHGWRDDVVPVDHSIRFAKSHRADLHIVDDNHRLEYGLDRLRPLFADFLGRVMVSA